MRQTGKAPLTIGRLAKLSGVKVTTIRYYESIGLIDPPDRSEGGQRLYGKAATDRANFIRHARELGLSLDAIRELIDLSGDEDRSCEAVDEIARRHVEDVHRKIERLKKLEAELNRMICECDANRVSDCRILAILSDHELCEKDHQ